MTETTHEPDGNFAKSGDATLYTLRQTRLRQVEEAEKQIELFLEKLDKLKASLASVTEELARRGYTWHGPDKPAERDLMRRHSSAADRR